jgi:Tfp pilus assembly protein PilZ
LSKGKLVSKKLTLLANGWVLFMPLFIAFALLIFRVDGKGLAQMLLAPGLWLTSAVAVWTGFAIRRIQWYAWYLFIFANLLVAYETAATLAYYSSVDYRLFLFIGTACLQLLMIWIVSREIRVPYYSPRIRWWESDPRYKLSIKVVLRDSNLESSVTGSTETAEIVDISRGGCFIKTNLHYEIDNVLHVSFHLFDSPIECLGQVVWYTESTFTHPKGIGLRFVDMDRETVKTLKDAAKRMKALAQDYTEMVRQRNWQEYLEREKQFQERRGGKGGRS